MNVKIGRHAPCPCGSGKKFKKCCETLPPSQASAASYSWMAPDGVHVVAPGGPLTPAELDPLPQTYQKQVGGQKQSGRPGRRCATEWPGGEKTGIARMADTEKD
jgi:hypothetical protein